MRKDMTEVIPPAPFQVSQLNRNELNHLLVRLQASRGNFLGAAAAFQAYGGHWLMVFVNRSFYRPEDAILTVGNTIAEGYKEAYLDEKKFNPAQLRSIGLYEVDNFEHNEVARILAQAKADTRGVKGTLDTNNFGLVDIDGKDTLTLGFVDLEKNTRTITGINLERF